MAVAFGLASCSSGLVPKSKLLHRPKAQYGFVPKHSLHGGKNIALRAEKPIFSTKTKTNTFWVSMVQGVKIFFSEAVFFPRKKSLIAEQCVVMSWLVRELAHGHKAMTAA